LHVELGCKPDCPQHPHRVFAIAPDRLADDAQALRLDILIAVQVIPDFFLYRIKK